MRLSRFFSVLAISAIAFSSFSSVEAANSAEKIVKTKPVLNFKDPLKKEELKKVDETKVLETDKILVAEAPEEHKKRSLKSIITTPDQIVLDEPLKRFLCYELSQRMKNVKEELSNFEDELALQKAKSIFFSIDQETQAKQEDMHMELGRIKKEYRRICNQ